MSPSPLDPVLVPEPLIFVDLETTGANFARDRIIEIGIVEVDGSGVREWSSLVDPGVPVSSFITGLTGIDSSMLVGAPSFGDLAPALRERLRGRLFVAHNARFDYSFLKSEFQRLGLEFRAPCLCTVKLSKKLFPEHHRHSLDTLLERFALTVGERHRALADARVLWQLWQRWHALRPAETIRQAVAGIVGRPARLPAQLDPGQLEKLDEVPEGPGAYALLGAEDGVLLVKRASNLRRQVYAALSDAPAALAERLKRVDWQEAAGDFGARLAEWRLGGRLGAAHPDLCSWQLTAERPGDFRPRLVAATDLDFARADDLFGLYANRREATQALRKLAEAHRLCHTLLGLGLGKPGEACVGYQQKTCRGACLGKEAPAAHGARLLTALARHKIKAWPWTGPVAIVESDAFGMREDWHVFDLWAYLGSSAAPEKAALLGERRAPGFDPEVYRWLSRQLTTGKLRVVALPLPGAFPESLAD